MTIVGAKPGRVTSWRVTEPVRFYVYPALLGCLAAWSAVGIAVGMALVTSAALLASAVGMVVGVECARQSVLSPAALIRAKQEETR